MSGRSYVMSPFYPISNNLDTSHRAGWARYWASELGAVVVTTSTMASTYASLKPGDTVYLYHGMEFKGQLNLQGGVDDTVLQRIADFISLGKKIKVVSLDQVCPDYGALFAERGVDADIAEKMTEICKKAKRMFTPHVLPKKIIIGDSHSLSMYEKGSAIHRSDGLTLHGVLQKGLVEHIGEWEWSNAMSFEDVVSATFYLGNIDIRHHLARQPDPKAATKDLVKRYVEQVAALPYKTKAIVLPLPIEDPSRKIPKSGWYKGEPFYGDWTTRNEIRKLMVAEIKRRAKAAGIEVIDHPAHFTLRLNGQLDMEVMEKPRSVHIRPSEYRVAQLGGGKWPT